MALTMPSPTRAMIVSSLAPPTSRSSLVRTVTRARARSWMPFLQTPSRVARPLVGSGQSITLGSTLRLTASYTSRPARSMAAATRQGRSMPALWAAITARATFLTSPLERKWASISCVVILTPACTRAIFCCTISRKSTLRSFMPIMSRMPMPAPVSRLWIHSWTKLKKMKMMIRKTTRATPPPIRTTGFSSTLASNKDDIRFLPKNVRSTQARSASAGTIPSLALRACVPRS